MNPPSYPAWYDEWMTYHLDLFGINEATVSASFMLWWESFEAMNVTQAELMAATKSMQGESRAPYKVGDHYFAIKAAIADVRDLAEQRTQHAIEERARANEQDKDKGVCVNCRDTGQAIVPHPRFCNGEAWRPYYHNELADPVFITAAVACSCWRGLKITANQRANSGDDDPGKKKKKAEVSTVQLTLATYENMVNGQWRQQMAEIEAARKRVADVDDRAIKDVKSLVKSIAAKPPRKGK